MSSPSAIGAGHSGSGVAQPTPPPESPRSWISVAANPPGGQTPGADRSYWARRSVEIGSPDAPRAARALSVDRLPGLPEERPDRSGPVQGQQESAPGAG